MLGVCLVNCLDLTSDVNIKCADVVCLCETWLSPCQDVPEMFNGHINVRCDRIASNNKGGVLMSINNTFHPFNTFKFSRGGIESLATSIVFANGEIVQIVLIYRSPNTPFPFFVNMLNHIFSVVVSGRSDTPMFVIGDFNDPNEHGTVSNLMNSHGFVQLVKQPTTDQGTLLDNVYCNTASDTIHVEVSDTYYSDHDTVFISAHT